MGGNTAPGIILGDTAAAGVSAEALQQAFALVQSWIAEGVLPGAAVLVARGGQIVGEAYLGVADRQTGRVVDQETIWGLASITKPVTATAVLMAVERGLLALDQPLYTLLPEFLDQAPTSAERRAITLRHTLAHCSGLPGFSANNLALRQAGEPISAFITAFMQQPVLFAPGTYHYYSNVGIGLAAEAVARALDGTLGQVVATPAIARYHQFVQEMILAPLEMRNSALLPPATWANRIARVEETGQDGTSYEMANSRYYQSLGIPWGGLFSTPRDLIRFVDLFLPSSGGRSRFVADAAPLLAPATVQAMTTIQYAPPDAPADLAPELRDGFPNDPPLPTVDWGLGWAVKGAKRGGELGDLTAAATFSHAGATGTLAWADPTQDLACIMLTNRARRSGWPSEQFRAARFANMILAAVS